MSLNNARASEERCRTSIRDAVQGVLGTTPERRAWVDASLDVMFELDGMTPFEAAMKAWKRGDRNMFDRALAIERRLSRETGESRASA